MKKLLVIAALAVCAAVHAEEPAEYVTKEEFQATVAAYEARIAALEKAAAPVIEEAKRIEEREAKMKELRQKRATQKKRLEARAEDPLKTKPEVIEGMNLLGKRFPSKGNPNRKGKKGDK